MIFTAMCLFLAEAEQTFAAEGKVPVVVITDLYFPAQDVGDNIDLVNAYLLPNIDLKAVLLDCHNEFRNREVLNVSKGLYHDKDGPREPGYSAVEQLNYIFDRNVPYAVGPFSSMNSPDDKMEYISNYESKALDLFKKVLEESDEPLSVVSFGSLRILAVANNRFPSLLKEKIKAVHICAGTSFNHPTFLEWNVALDTTAFVSVLKSELPINIYPCAAGDDEKVDPASFNAFTKDKNNTFYQIPNLNFFNYFPDELKNYFHYALLRETKANYLALLDSAFCSDPAIFDRPHKVWETAVWMQVAGLRLVKHGENNIKLLLDEEVEAGDDILLEKLRPCTIKVKESGIFTYEFDESGDFCIYEREDPELYETWMNKALPDFYIDLAREKISDRKTHHIN